MVTERTVNPDQYLPVFKVLNDGCKWSPSCFTCPLPECMYDQRHGQMRLNVEEKHQHVVTAIEEGATVGEAAVRFSYKERTIQRIVQKARLKVERRD